MCKCDRSAQATMINPKQATDLGCGTGLSMYMLDSKWPSIEKVTGVDLSTFKLAVCEDKKSMMVRTFIIYLYLINISFQHLIARQQEQQVPCVPLARRGHWAAERISGPRLAVSGSLRASSQKLSASCVRADLSLYWIWIRRIWRTC